MKKLQFSLIYVTITIFTAAGCGQKPSIDGFDISAYSKEDRAVLLKRKESMDAYISENPELSAGADTKDKAVQNFLNSFTDPAANPYDHICTDQEYLKIFIPNMKPEILYVPASTPENMLKIRQTFRDAGIQDHKDKLKGDRLRDVIIKWDSPDKRKSVTVHRILSAHGVTESGGTIEFEGLKIVIQKDAKFKLCVISTG